MAKFTEAEKKQKIDQAKQLYCKGFDYECIAEFLTVSITTVRKWATENDFEKSKRSQIIALSAIRDSILESYADLLDGKKPKVSPDQAAKYAVAFERFSAKKQVLSYMHEAFSLFSEAFIHTVQRAKTAKEKQQQHEHYRVARNVMDSVLTKLTEEVLGDE